MGYALDRALIKPAGGVTHADAVAFQTRTTKGSQRSRAGGDLA